MAGLRQVTFQKLRPPCVELSSVGLRFKANQATAKEVLHAVENQNKVLVELANQDRLDRTLAEYAFFPLTHVFNEAQRLSSRCLEVAIKSVDVLITQGWRQQLASEMGKQLLILMTLLAGGEPRKQMVVPTDELKLAALSCVASICKWLPLTSSGQSIIADESTRHIVDQLVYLLSETLSDDTIDVMQIAAAQALVQIFESISDHVFLASLVPRTVSSAVKALKPNSNARRPYKVLSSSIHLLQIVLVKVLGDDVLAEAQSRNPDVLDNSWLKATTSQVRNAMLQVVKSRRHDRAEVRDSLADLCLLIVEHCGKSLSDSIPIMVETLVVLMESSATGLKTQAFNHLIRSRPELIDLLRSKFYDWTQSLPRVLQGNDDVPKDVLIKNIACSYNLVTNEVNGDNGMANTLTAAMLRGVSAMIEQDKEIRLRVQDASDESYLMLSHVADNQHVQFQPVLFGDQSQRALSQHLEAWIANLKSNLSYGRICRDFVDAVDNSDGSLKLAALWLATKVLATKDSIAFDLEDLILTESAGEQIASKPWLIHDLYSSTKILLLDAAPYSDADQDWRITALALQAVVLQAQQLRRDYRNELLDTLYPVLALFGARNGILQSNAVATLNLLALACEYSSAKEMLMENIDYIVNSVAWKLNTFNLSPEAPQVLNMVVKLAGSDLLPYIDDLIASILTALDNFHGYPSWVELMFSVLKTTVDESTKNPGHAMIDLKTFSLSNIAYNPSSVQTVIASLRNRKNRKLGHAREKGVVAEQGPTPHRPWTTEKDGSGQQVKTETEDMSLEDLLKQDEVSDLPAPDTATKTNDKDPMTPMSKSHSLLLKIAESTVPHLASPSPRVRHLLLQLLTQVCPVLAHHENTFLPLINSIWPVIIPRLFAEQSSSLGISLSSEGIDELPYNTVVAAQIITIICHHAGNFMSSRIEQISRQLMKLFDQTCINVYGQGTQNRHRQSNMTRSSRASSNTGTPASTKLAGIPNHLQMYQTHSPDTNLGSVDLRIVHNSGNLTADLSNATAIPDLSVASSAIRTSQAQILMALVSLLSTILMHVSISAGFSEEVVACLARVLTNDRSQESRKDGPQLEKHRQRASMMAEEIRKSIKAYNPDVLWLIEQRYCLEETSESTA